MSERMSKKDLERAEAAKRKAAALRANLKRRKTAKRKDNQSLDKQADGAV